MQTLLYFTNLGSPKDIRAHRTYDMQHNLFRMRHTRDIDTKSTRINRYAHSWT